MRDPHEVLGVPRGASEDEVRRAYKKLALQHHPDRGGDPEKFKELSAAHEQLTEGPGPGPGQFTSNPFEGIFGFQQNAKRPDKIHEYTMNLSLDDAWRGITKTFRITREPDCGACGGHGVFFHEVRMGPFTQTLQQPCPACEGQGTVRGHSEQLQVTIEVPRGTPDGARFTRGQVAFLIRVAEHPVFTRRGGDLFWEPKITFQESVEGSVLECPHFDGPVELNTRDWCPIDPRKEYRIANLITKFDVQY